MKLRSFALLLICMLLCPMLVGAAPVTVTKKATGCTINGADTVEAGTPYSFTVTPFEGHVITDVYTEVAGLPMNLNKGEGVTARTGIMPQMTAGANNPGIAHVTDTDSPMTGMLPYKRVITNHTGGPGKSTYTATSMSACMGVTAYSFGFWAKDSDVAYVYRTGGTDSEIQFWMYYGGPFALISIPVLATALQTVGGSVSLNLGTGGDTVYKSYTATARCLAKENGWTYYAADVENIVYQDTYNTKAPTFYAVYNNVRNANMGFEKPDAKLEMSNFTLLANAKLASAYFVYPDAIGKAGKLAPQKSGDGYLVPATAVAGNITIGAEAYSDAAVQKHTVGCSITGADSVPISEPYTFTIKPDKGYTLSQCYAYYNGVRVELPTGSLSVTMPAGRYLTDVDVYALCLPSGTLPMEVAVNDNNLVTRTAYTDTQDLTHRFTGLTANPLDANPIVNFQYSYVIAENDPDIWATTKALGGGGDEATPFNFNSSYIGANHGQSNGVTVTAAAHGKTYADIGSYWEDAAGRKWSLLKVPSTDTLLFLSDNKNTNRTKYSFVKTITSPLTYISDGEHTDAITVSAQVGSVQVYSSTKHSEKQAYAVVDGKRFPISGVMQTRCDYVDIVEKYQIMNPSLIGEYLRAARPVGGYTEPQSMAVGEPLIDYSIIYRILPDGTTLTIMDHEVLEDISFGFYGGIQYHPLPDAYGGGVWRFQPKTKPFTVETVPYDFSKPFNVTVNDVPGYTMPPASWESPTNAPDRQVEYYRDTTGKEVALFAGGYLPIDDGAPEVRYQKNTASYFLYRTKKSYPYFVSGGTIGKQGTHIRGVAYKKFQSQEADSSIGSMYTVPYGDSTYIYMDYFETGTDTLALTGALAGKTIKLVEKSDNVTYAQSGDTVSVNVTARTEGNGYLVLLASDGLAQLTVSESAASVKGLEVPCRLLLGTYDANGELLQTKVKSISADGTFSYDDLGLSLTGAKTVRGYLWDGIKPLAKAQTEDL